MRSKHKLHPDRQRITVTVDVVPGPYAQALAGRLLHVVTEELRVVGFDVAAVKLEIKGDVASW